MKYPVYKTKRFWKLVEKEYMTTTTNYGEPFIFLCYGSFIFKKQWESADFRAFCRRHAQIVLGDCIADKADVWGNDGPLCTGDRQLRLRFLAYMVATISLRRPKNQ